MDVTLNRATVLEELQLIQGVVERRTTIPILSNILLTAEGDRLHLAATDLDVTVYTQCSAVVRKEGRTTIHGKVFFDLVRSLPAETLDLSWKEARVEVRSGPFNSQLASLDPADFPTLPEVPDGQGFAVDLAVLRRLIDRSVFAVSAEEGHFQYNAALLLVSAKFLEMVATDGHRLAWAKATHGSGAPPFEHQLLPARFSTNCAISAQRRTRRSTSPAGRTTSRSGSATVCCSRAFSRHGFPSTSGCSSATTRIEHAFNAKSWEPPCGALRSSRVSGRTAFRCSSTRMRSGSPRSVSTSDRRRKR
jgi:hypothetical protein